MGFIQTYSKRIEAQSNISDFMEKHYLLIKEKNLKKIEKISLFNSKVNIDLVNDLYKKNEDCIYNLVQKNYNNESNNSNNIGNVINNCLDRESILQTKYKLEESISSYKEEYDKVSRMYNIFYNENLFEIARKRKKSSITSSTLNLINENSKESKEKNNINELNEFSVSNIQGLFTLSAQEKEKLKYIVELYSELTMIIISFLKKVRENDTEYVYKNYYDYLNSLKKIGENYKKYESESLYDSIQKKYLINLSFNSNILEYTQTITEETIKLFELERTIAGHLDHLTMTDHLDKNIDEVIIEVKKRVIFDKYFQNTIENLQKNVLYWELTRRER